MLERKFVIACTPRSQTLGCAEGSNLKLVRSRSDAPKKSPLETAESDFKADRRPRSQTLKQTGDRGVRL